MSSEQRRLAAIVSADVAGYSRLMGRDESGTLAALKTLRREIVDPKIRAHRGRVVKTAGDGLLLEFASAVDAARCCVDIQAAMAGHNADVPEERRIAFRVGVNIGDIIIDGDDIFGDGVNVAARLQEIAEPGGICVSDFVQQQVTGKIEASISDIGEQQVKNIARPIRAWRLHDWVTSAPPTATPGAPAPAGAAAGVTLGERSARPAVAVLPFDNMGGDADIESFCDGLSEDLITTLSSFRWVQVVSRKSSFAYKGRSPDVRQVARELGVNFVLEGSVRRAGGRVRINAQLINAVSGTHAWARRFDREFADPFELQDEIVRSVISSLDYALWIAMIRGETGVGKPDPQTSPLRASAWHMIQCTPADNVTALACARRAMELNPHSAAAWQYETLGHNVDLMSGWCRDFAADTTAGVASGRRAVALSPLSALSHSLHSVPLAFSGDAAGAFASGRRALSLDSNSANSLGPVASAMSLVGDAQEAHDLLSRLLDAAPGHYYRSGFLSHMALNCLRLQAPKRGLSPVEEAVKLNPEVLVGHVARAAVLAALGRRAEASAALLQARGHRADFGPDIVRAMVPYSNPIDETRLMDLLRLAGIEDGAA